MEATYSRMCSAGHNLETDIDAGISRTIGFQAGEDARLFRPGFGRTVITLVYLSVLVCHENFEIDDWHCLKRQDFHDWREEQQQQEHWVGFLISTASRTSSSDLGPVAAFALEESTSEMLILLA